MLRRGRNAYWGKQLPSAHGVPKKVPLPAFRRRAEGMGLWKLGSLRKFPIAQDKEVRVQGMSLTCPRLGELLRRLFLPGPGARPCPAGLRQSLPSQLWFPSARAWLPSWGQPALGQLAGCVSQAMLCRWAAPCQAVGRQDIYGWCQK